MSGITVVAPGEEVADALKERYRDSHVVRRVWSESWPSPGSAVVEIVAAAPEVVILGPGVGRDDSLDLLIELDRTQPQTGIVVLLEEADTDDILEFLRNGAREVLDAGAPMEEIGDSLDKTVQVLEQRRSNLSTNASTKRRVIALLSPKGGTGKTTLATNLAVGMAQRAKSQVLLIDLDVQFGDAAPALGLTPEYSLANATAIGAMDRASLKVFLTVHSSTLAVLAPPEDFAQTDALEISDLKATIAALSEEFPYVVIDTAAGIDDFSLLATEFATDLLFVTTTDVASIRAVKRQLDALDQLGLIGHRRHFVLNRADAKAGLSQADIEASIGMPASIKIPVSRGLPLSTNQGEPLLLSESRDGATRSLEQLVDRFLPETAERPSRGFRLFSKKD